MIDQLEQAEITFQPGHAAGDRDAGCNHGFLCAGDQRMPEGKILALADQAIAAGGGSQLRVSTTSGVRRTHSGTVWLRLG